MAKIYRVYDVSKNEFVGDYDKQRDAVQRADDLCGIDQNEGKIYEVHELDDSDTQLANPRLVHRCRA